jgi:hypothetical protein
MIAHVAGVPLEEAVVPLLGGVSTVLLLARAWATSRLRRPRGPRRERHADANGPRA